MSATYMSGSDVPDLIPQDDVCVCGPRIIGDCWWRYVCAYCLRLRNTFEDCPHGGVAA